MTTSDLRWVSLCGEVLDARGLDVLLAAEGGWHFENLDFLNFFSGFIKVELQLQGRGSGSLPDLSNCLRSDLLLLPLCD